MDDIRPHLKIIDGVASDAFINDFNLFLATDNKLLKTIFTNLKFELDKEINDEIKKLSEIIPLDLKNLETIVKVGNIIFVHLENKQITIEDLRDDFEKLKCDKKYYEKVKALYDDFGKNYAIERLKYDTIRSNLYSLSPKVIKILYELNIRAIESKEEENQKIIDRIPVARIEFESNIEIKGLRNALGLETKKFAFNATADDLEKIIDDLNKIKLKLNVLPK